MSKRNVSESVKKQVAGRQRYSCATIEGYNCPMNNQPFDESGYDIDHIVEVDEDEMMVSMYSYIPKPIPEKLIIPIDISLLNINPEIKYGSIEVSVTVNDENEQEHYLRYRVSVYLKDIKVGKIHAIENMINYGQVFFDLALDSMCVEKEFKKWALN